MVKTIQTGHYIKIFDKTLYINEWIFYGFLILLIIATISIFTYFYFISNNKQNKKVFFKTCLKLIRT